MRLAAEVAHDIAEMVRPGIKLSVSEASAKYVKVKGKGGGVDSWSAVLTPYMLEPMDCMTSREYEGVIFAGSAQSGKTQGLLFGTLAHGIICEKADMMVVQTSVKTAGEWERGELSWTIRNSPELKARLADGSRADNVYVKSFKSGNNLFLAWPTISNLSGKALKIVLLTDYDRMNPILGEGSVYHLARKRNTTFLSRGKTLAESSPSGEITDAQWQAGDDNPHEAPPSQSQILALFNEGDRRRFYVQCPECGQHYLPPCDEKGLDFPINVDVFGVTSDVLTRPAMYVCTANGCLIDTKHKRAMITSGQWVKEGQKIVNGQIVGEGRKSRIASFWFPGIFAAYSDPQKLAQLVLSGLRKFDLDGDEESLRAILNVDFGAPYLSRKRVAEYSAQDYKKRAEPMPEKMVPDGVRFLVAAVDVQGWGFSVAIVGYGINFERWLIDRYEIRVSDRVEGGQKMIMQPAVHEEDWEKIHSDVMQKTYPLADGSGRNMQILMTASDSGGEDGVTDHAYKFWRSIRKRRLNDGFILVKGEAPKPKALKPKVKKTYPENTGKTKGVNARGEIPVWLVNTTMLKDALAAALKKEQSASRYIHFPSWLPDAIYNELTVETREESGWVKPKGKKNELWDQFIYAEAAVEAVLQEKKLKEISWDNPPPWARPWGDNPLVTGDKPAEQKQAAIAEKSKPAINNATQQSWLPSLDNWIR
jgi:phage terminase large subunit GpA-like protein